MRLLNAIRGVSLYIWAGGAAVLLIGFEAWVQSRPVLEEMRTELSALESRQLDTYLDTSKLLTTLATAVIGAAGGLLLRTDAKLRLTRPDRRRIIASQVFAALSIYCGHLAHQNLVWMLHSKFFNLYYGGVRWPARMQFWLFLGAVIVLADFVYRSLSREETV